MPRVILPQEVEVWYVLPTIRKKIALELIRQGLTQKQVAKLLGTTEASISHYKKDKRAKENLLGDKIDSIITEAADKIVKSPSVLLTEIIRINTYVKEQGLFCKIYRQKSQASAEQLPCNHCSDDKICHKR